MHGQERVHRGLFGGGAERNREVGTYRCSINDATRTNRGKIESLSTMSACMRATEVAMLPRPTNMLPSWLTKTTRCARRNERRAWGR